MRAPLALVHECDAHAPTGQVLNQEAQVVQVPCEVIHAMHVNCVALVDKREKCVETLPLDGSLEQQRDVAASVLCNWSPKART